MTYLSLTELFVHIDDFYKNNHSVKKIGPKYRESRMSNSEILTILIYFHFSQFRNFKAFYSFIKDVHNKEFPQLVSYNRFVELKKTILIDLCGYLLKRMKVGKKGIYFIDSTSIKVCHNKRISRNLVFRDLAERGKTTMGWFFGFKLHLIIDDTGEIVAFDLTKGNVDDRKPLPKITKNIFGKLYGDKGYIGKKWFDLLFSKGLRLVTNLKSNMKPKIIPIADKIILKKRFLIETVNDQLKNLLHLEHTRHRSPTNFLVNLFAGIAAYTHLPKKPSISWHSSERLFLEGI